MDHTIISIILTSTLIATIVSVIISSIVSIKLKQLDYKNEYYKKILDKRLNVYHHIENQIAVLKSSVLDDDGKAFHLIFSSGKEEFGEFQQNLFLAMSYSLWINDNTIDNLEKLNDLFFKISRQSVENDDELIAIGKEHYNAIADLRKRLEANVKSDLIDLHNFKRFKSNPLKRKKRTIEF